jgi:hypothetical protein
MPFRSENFPVLALLIELHLDCWDARNAIRRFRDGCRTWRLRRGGMTAVRALTPGDTFAWAFACLAAFNRIRLMLDAGSRRRPVTVTRCSFLQKTLNHPRLEHVCAPAVRHAWEHFDERLDTIITGTRPKRYSHESISPDPPDGDTLVFRRVDPLRLRIHVLDQVIPVGPCLDEVRALDAAVIAAHDSLADGRVVRLGA